MNVFRRIDDFLRSRAATAGVEFAIGAPVMLGGLLIMTDIGLAFNSQMNLDQALRTGAEFAMGEIRDPDTLENLIAAAAAGADPDDPGDVADDAFPTAEVVESCACPGSDAVVTCTVLCTGDVIPSMYYTMTASKTHKAIFLPDFALSAQIQVQVR